MLLALHRSLVKPLEPSSCAAARLGPKALMPAAVRSSTMPAQSGASGPTTTRSMFCALQNAITAAWSATSSATTSQSRAMPALPGAQKSRATSGLAEIFQASACSRPPEPRRRIFIVARRMIGRRGVAWSGILARHRRPVLHAAIPRHQSTRIIAMTEVFLSYNKADRPVAEAIARELHGLGVNVWWDHELLGGEDYRNRMSDILGRVRVAIVIWSRRSVESQWVINEAAAAREMKVLVPVTIDGHQPPIDFRALHTTDLAAWTP